MTVTTIDLDVDSLKDQLLAEQSNLRTRIQSRLDSIREIKEANIGRSPEDIAQENEDRSRFEGENKVDESRLKLVISALRRVDQDEYGFCRACGDDIEGKRLAANPAALNCITCQNRLDTVGKHYR